MQAIIMAGGLGTRLKTITEDLIPKSMVSICGKPLLWWQIKNLHDNGVDNIIVVTGYLSECILQSEELNEFHDFVKYYEEEKPLGTAGALKRLDDKGLLEEDFILVYGDLFFDIDFESMITAYVFNRGQGTVFVHPNSHPQDSNIIILDDDNLIKDILPKNMPHHSWYHNRTSAGIYIFNRSIIDFFPNEDKVDLERQVLPYLRYLYSYWSTEYVKDIGTSSRYYQVCKDVQHHIPEKRNFKRPQKAIFLDRDGTINYDDGLIYKEDKFILYPWAAKAIRLINDSEYLAIVVTNQSVVARGLCTMEDVETIHKKMETQLGQDGAYLNDIFFCPHHPDKGYEGENPRYKVKCQCRKPNPGMLKVCEWVYHVDLSKSFLIGDTDRDRQTAYNAGVHPVIIHEDAENLLDAVYLILGDEL